MCFRHRLRCESQAPKLLHSARNTAPLPPHVTQLASDSSPAIPQQLVCNPPTACLQSPNSLSAIAQQLVSAACGQVRFYHLQHDECFVYDTLNLRVKCVCDGACFSSLWSGQILSLATWRMFCLWYFGSQSEMCLWWSVCFGLRKPFRCLCHTTGRTCYSANSNESSFRKILCQKTAAA